MTPSGTWSGRPSRTSRASTIAPAQVPSTASPPAMASASGARSPDVSRRRCIVVDSPPGSTIASRPLIASGVRTSTVSTPSASRTSPCSRNAPWSASTPAFIAASARSLPTPLRELDVELVDLGARHRGAEPPRHLRDDAGVGVVRGRLDDGLRHHLGLLALEDAGADEHRLRAELHHERRVGRRGDATRTEHRDRQLAARGDLLHELDRRPQLLGRGEELLGGGDGEAADGAEDRTEVADRLDDVAGAGLALRPDHA